MFIVYSTMRGRGVVAVLATLPSSLAIGISEVDDDDERLGFYANLKRGVVFIYFMLNYTILPCKL